MSALTPVPPHVKPEQVFDFDFYADASFGAELHASLKQLHEKAPDVFWTPRNGGHWMIIRHAQIAEVVQDPEHFSAREMQIPRIPNPPVFLPLSLDPPANVPYRQALMPAFSPKAVKEMEGKIRYWANYLVEQVADKGECDFVHDIAEQYPVSIFMELMGMDLGRLREFRELAERFFSVQNDAEQFADVSGRIVGIMTAYIEQKRTNPDDGLISQLIKAQIDGRPITLEELQNMCFLLFAGGLHTVTNLVSFAYWRLAEMPELQQRLAADPALIPKFVDEAIRMFGVIHTPRIVAKDCERFGAQFREGEMVLSILSLAGMDDRVNNDPMRFDIDRDQREYLTFSRGPHLCIGHFLARSEIRILTEEWLKRIPAFKRKAGVDHQQYTTSTGLGLVTLPLEW
jgi:cytochrome P450